jgi:hypothetical protein
MNTTRMNDSTTGHPAPHDQDPQTVLESVLAGTPAPERLDKLVRLLGVRLAAAASAPPEPAAAVDPEDERYSRMPQAEFEREKQDAKADRRFGSWTAWRNWVERIDALRRAPPTAAAPPAKAPAPDALAGVPAETLDTLVRLVAGHLLRPTAYEDRLSWGNQLELQQLEAEQRYVRMTTAEFELEKQRAKRDRRFGTWEAWRDWVERTDRLRRPPPPANPARRTGTPLEQALAYRRECLENAHAIFETEADFHLEVARVNAEIRRLGGTVPRPARTDDERTAVTNIEARLRQARALAACRRLLAAHAIRLFLRLRRRSECPICGDPAPADSVYCSRSCRIYAQ